jgi:hypothetical protein
VPRGIAARAALSPLRTCDGACGVRLSGEVSSGGRPTPTPESCAPSPGPGLPTSASTPVITSLSASPHLPPPPPLITPPGPTLPSPPPCPRRRRPRPRRRRPRLRPRPRLHRCLRLPASTTAFASPPSPKQLWPPRRHPNHRRSAARRRRHCRPRRLRPHPRLCHRLHSTPASTLITAAAASAASAAFLPRQRPPHRLYFSLCPRGPLLVRATLAANALRPRTPAPPLLTLI